MKISAGPWTRRLNGRKPRHAQPIASETTSTRSFGCWVTASIAKANAPIAARVAASPSMLSSRLNAFVIPTSQTSAIATPMIGFATSCTLSPVESTTAAAASCAPILTGGLSVRRSSISPAVKRIRQPARIPKSSQLASTAPTATLRLTPARSPATMPTPPSEGVDSVDQRSPVGAATTRRAKRDRSVAQTTA